MKRLILFLVVWGCANIAQAYSWITYNYAEVDPTDGLTRNYRIAFPDDYVYVRGILVNFNASSSDTRGEYLSPYYKEFLRFHQFAFIGTEGLAQPSANSNPASLRSFTNAIASFVTQSGKSEIANAPWAIIVASAGGGPAWINTRTNAVKVIAVSNGSGTFGAPPVVAPADTLSVPFLLWSGDNDAANVAVNLESFVATNRPSGLRGAYAELKDATHVISIAVHGVGMANLHESILLSYPVNQCVRNGPITLNRIPESSGWLINTNTIRSAFPTISDYASYVGTKSVAHWVASSNVAFVYRAFAAHNTNIFLSTPSDSTEVNPGANITITVNASAFAGWTNIAIYSFATNLANFTSGTPTFVLSNVVSGVHLFSAIATKGGTNVVTKPIMVSVRKTVAPAYVCGSNSFWYASPSGVTNNLGTIASPWDLRTAFHKTASIAAGDTLYLRGGIYTVSAPEGAQHTPTENQGTVWNCLLSGAYGNPITIRAYPNEWPILDGGAFGGIYASNATARPTLQIGSSSSTTVGRFLILRDFEVTSTSTETRTSSMDGSLPTDLKRSDGVGVFGVSNQLVNIVCHDLTAGFSIWEQASETTASGLIAYNNGWIAPSQRHGHGFYTQNTSSRGIKEIFDCIVPNNCDNAIQAYGSGTAGVWHYRIHNNTFYNNRVLLGGKTGATQGDIQYRDNLQFNSDLAALYQITTGAVDEQVANNYVGGGTFQDGMWTSSIITNNTFIMSGTKVFDLLTQPFGNVPTGWTVDNNHYFFSSNATTGTYFVDEGNAFYNFAGWKAHTGWDANSTVAAPNPATNMSVVRVNAHDSNRGDVTVYNWALSNSVAVSLALLGWTSGDSVRVRNCQDYFVDITTNALIGNTLTLNMQAGSHTVAMPRGASVVFGAKSFPTFGAFVIERVTGATPTPTNTITITSSAATGATITATTDINGNGSGTTPFNRSYLYSTVVNLVAPLTFGTNNFSKWTRMGVDYSFTNSISFNISTNETWVAAYAAPPITTWTFALSSTTPNSGVTIGVTPNDNSSLGNGVTPFNRTYNDGAAVQFVAPLTAGGNDFQSWSANGSFFSTTPTINLNANSAGVPTNPFNLAANYAVPAVPTNIVIVTAVGTTAVPIVVSLADVDGAQNGTTVFSRSYLTNATVQLIAPATSSGLLFVEWRDENDAPLNTGNTTNSFVMNANRTRKAVYQSPLSSGVSLGRAVSRRRGTRQ